MDRDLTTSAFARKNVLNNPYALKQLEANLALGGLNFRVKPYLPSGNRQKSWPLMSAQSTAI